MRERSSRSEERKSPVSEYEGALKIDKNNLDEELSEQPELFFRVSDQLALAISRKDAAKHKLEICEADVEEVVRLGARDNKSKITNDEVKAAVTLHRDVQSARDNLIHLTHVASQWQALVGAFTQRSYVLKDLVALHLRAYYLENSAGERQKQYDNIRDRLAEERSRQRGR